ncbi:MAG: hypothetical protein ACTSXP_03835 [Promethearchaeota archaeon]
MNINDALISFKKSVQDSDVFVSQAGQLSQYLFRHDRRNNFYMTADLGELNSFSLGLALNIKNRVFAFQQLNYFLKNLCYLHSVLNHPVYNLTITIFDFQYLKKEQDQFLFSFSRKFNFMNLLKSLGFNNIHKIQKADQIHGAIKKSSKLEEISIFYLIISEKSPLPPLIITHSSLEMKDRFMKAMDDYQKIPR